MKKTFLIIFFILSIFTSNFILGDELEDITKQLDEAKKTLEETKQNKKQTLEELNKNKEKIDNIVNTLSKIKVNLVKKESDIEKKEGELAYQKEILSKRASFYFKNKINQSMAFLELFASDDFIHSSKMFVYQKSALNQDKNVINTTVKVIKKIEEEKNSLRDEKNKYEDIEKEINIQTDNLAKNISETEKKEKEFSKKIDELSAKQQSILSARAGQGFITVGEVPTNGDRNATIAFKSDAPSGSFAVFSFGAYTHRNGMSQYGAKSRSEEGKNAKEILSIYFPGSSMNENFSIPEKITVDGYGEMPFKDYLLGIYEMPESWPIEALKAQAILARTYAIRYTDGGKKPICATESCQVFKPEKKTGNWQKAVEETEKWVLENITTAQYSAVTGGYTNTAGWDTTDKTNTGTWTSRAYESKAGAPWFYKAWYRKSYRDDSDSCGKNSPWLSQEEFSDIINSWIVMKNPQGADINRILPITINQCSFDGATNGNPYSFSEMRDYAKKSKGSVSNISSVSVSYNNEGQSTNVHLSTNIGEIDISGEEFKKAFNIRAPGFISIRQTGFAFFNIEYKP